MNCDHQQHLAAFYDGELSPRQHAEMEIHLAGCADCRRELASLQQLSTVLTRAPLALPSQIAMARLEAAPRLQERAVRRMAGWMTAAAAVVLAFSLWQQPTTTDAAVPMTAIELAATLSDEEPPPATLTVARWMATDLALASAAGGSP